MKKYIFMAVCLMVNLLFTQGALSHPHMFLDTHAGFKVDKDNRLQSIVLRFVVDEFNTTLTIATLDLDKDGDKKFTTVEKEKVADSVLGGFAHYKFFTYLWANDTEVALNAPKHVGIDFDRGQLVISMEIGVEKPLPVVGKSMTLKLYDPSYFTEVSIIEAPQIIGDIDSCRVKFSKSNPDQNSRKLQAYLSQLSREETPEIENVGELFADKTRLICTG